MLTGSINVHTTPIHVDRKSETGEIEKIPMTYVFKNFELKEVKSDAHVLQAKQGAFHTIHSHYGLLIDIRNLSSSRTSILEDGTYSSQLTPAKGEFRAYANMDAEELKNLAGESTFINCYMFAEKMAKPTLVCCTSVEFRFKEYPVW